MREPILCKTIANLFAHTLGRLHEEVGRLPVLSHARGTPVSVAFELVAQDLETRCQATFSHPARVAVVCRAGRAASHLCGSRHPIDNG